MKNITIIPLLALLAVTGCGKQAADNQPGANNSTPPSAGAGNPTNTPSTSALPEIPPPATTPPAPSTTPVPAPEMTSPGNGADTNAPAATNNPAAPNPPTGS